MQSSNKELAEKIQLIALTLGSYTAQNKYFLFGDNSPIDILKKTESWTKKTEIFSIEYEIEQSFTAKKLEYSKIERIRLSAKGIFFPKTVYFCDYEKVHRGKSDWWEDTLNKLYAKAVRLKKWREEVAAIKHKLNSKEETTCLIN